LFTILHISDLHRSREEPIDNDSLIAALLGDSDRYLGETPPVPQPRAIVVSGDLVQGVGVGADKWVDSMRDQYRVLLLGAAPRWSHSRNWGYYPTGGVGLILLIVVILVILGRI